MAKWFNVEKANLVYMIIEPKEMFCWKKKKVIFYRRKRGSQQEGISNNKQWESMLFQDNHIKYKFPNLKRKSNKSFVIPK